jgi:hypothetical protein
VSRARLLAFVRELALDGKMNEATAAFYATAVRQMLAEASGEEPLSLGSVELEALSSSLRRREGMRAKARTLESYHAALERVLELYETWAERDRRERPVFARRWTRRRAPTGGQRPDLSAHFLSLAPDRVAELRVPSDLTVVEARRLGRVLEALARNAACQQRC